PESRRIRRLGKLLLPYPWLPWYCDRSTADRCMGMEQSDREKCSEADNSRERRTDKRLSRSHRKSDDFWWFFCVFFSPPDIVFMPCRENAAAPTSFLHHVGRMPLPRHRFCAMSGKRLCPDIGFTPCRGNTSAPTSF